MAFWTDTIILTLLLLQLSTLARSQSQSQSLDQRPNILIILTDDEDAVSNYEMPLRRKLLAEEGVTFYNAFVHTPICCSSRSSILSGRYLHNGGALNNTFEGNCYGKTWREQVEPRSLSVHAQKAGYVTMYAGKYLNKYGITPETRQVPIGWDKWLGLVADGRRYYNSTLVHSEDGGKTIDIIRHGDDDEKDYLPDVLANVTMQWISEAAHSNKPFLMFLAYPSPHQPYTPAKWAQDLDPNVKAPRPANWNASWVYQQQKHWLLRQLPYFDETVASFIDKAYKLRRQCLRSIDVHMRLYYDELKELGLLDNTYIIYISDNGYQLGQHRLAIDKRHLYENDIRVPMIVRGPGIKVTNTTSPSIVLNIDLAPTVYEIVNGEGAPPAGDMDGESFLPLVRERAPSTSRHDFLVSYHGEGYPPCGLNTCPMPSPPWSGPDSSNNTYHCVRTIVVDGEDSIYCKFEDTEQFEEYYDLSTNPYQLDNQIQELSTVQQQRYVARLKHLRSCHGASCRS